MGKMGFCFIGKDMKKEKFGVPYMGSKRGISDKIVDYILSYNPNVKYIYDLFGGGGAVSFEFLQRAQIKKVIYNELNTGVCELLKDIQKTGITDKYYVWIDRETFNNHKNDSDWFGGFIKTCWSFGNNQKNYLYSKEIEEYKHNYHLVVVNGIDILKEMKSYCMDYVFNKYGIKQDLKLVMPVKENIFERKLEIRGQLNNFEKLCKLSTIRVLQQLQSLERLQSLQRLERLERLESLEILNKDYREVLVNTPIEETIIYLDPPYEGTGTYQKDINHNELIEYIKSSAYKIYISSYSLEKYGFKSVLEIDKRCILSSINKKRVTEKLYCNRYESLVL